jgi:hypothetical protein
MMLLEWASPQADGDSGDVFSHRTAVTLHSNLGMWRNVSELSLSVILLKIRSHFGPLGSVARIGVDPTLLSPGAICLQLARFNGMLQSGPVPVPL